MPRLPGPVFPVVSLFGFGPRISSLVVSGLLAVAALGPVDGAQVAATGEPAPSTALTGRAVFASLRLADPSSERGPYPVEVRQLAGKALAGGWLVFTTQGPGGAPSQEVRVPLRPGPHPESGPSRRWTAEIPGQPRGTTVRYHFVLAGSIRHPRDEVVSYRFQVRPSTPRVGWSRISGSRIPGQRGEVDGTAGIGRAGGGEERWRVHLTFGAPDPQHPERASPDREPRAELVARRFPAAGRKASPGPDGVENGALRIPFQRTSPGSDPPTDSWYADLPALEAGDLVDFHVKLRHGGEDTFVFPPGAPDQAFSVKRSVREIRHLPVAPGLVLALATGGRDGEDLWVGYRGAGAELHPGRLGRGSAAIRKWSLAEGLPSAVVRWIDTDPATGRVWIGTDAGLAEISAAGPRWIRGPGGTPILSAVGPGAVSTLDGTLLFQAEGAAVAGDLGRSTPGMMVGEAPPRFFELSSTGLSSWRPEAGPAFTGWTALAFDSAAGCWLLGGPALNVDARPAPAVARRCGERVEGAVLEEISVEGEKRTPVRVVALAAEPSSGTPVAALELGPGPRDLRWGVYRIDPRTGEAEPLAPELSAVPVEITALAADPRRSRLLVATWGQGVWGLSAGTARRLDLQGLPTEVTRLAVADAEGPRRDRIGVGTADGAYLWSPGVETDGTVVRLGRRAAHAPGASDALPADALPYDAQPPSPTGPARVLWSSRSRGLVELTESGDGPHRRWALHRQLQAGRELPPGQYGPVAYGPADELLALIHGEGLLRIPPAPATPRLLGPEQGLHSRLPLRLLVRDLGEIWVSYTPTPIRPGSPVQVLQGDRVVTEIPLRQNEMASIGKWLEIPWEGAGLGPVLAATRAGVLALGGEEDGGQVVRHSTATATAVAWDPTTETLLAVGSSILRWRDGRFQPLLFGIDHPRVEPGRFVPGTPRDLALDRRGRAYLLYPDGLVVLLDEEGGFLGILDREDGVPSTARRLLAHPATGDVWIGSAAEGPVIVPMPWPVELGGRAGWRSRDTEAAP